MKVLVDSSVWIEFFQPQTTFSLHPLESLIQDRLVATCLPIKTEVLSGRMSAGMRNRIGHAFDAMDFVDLDWNSRETWNGLIEISRKAQKEKVSIPGIIDRMILACGLKARLPLWTLDRKLQQLATALHQPLFQHNLL